MNATGLENKDLHGKQPKGTGPDEESEVSAKDMALLAQHLIKDHPEILETSSIAKTKFREGTDDEMDMPNWNFMLKGLVKEYEGVDGLKTGSTDSAGSSFTGTAKQGDMRVIAVILNAKGNLHTARFDVAKKLFDYAFKNFTMKEMYKKVNRSKDMKTSKSTKAKTKKYPSLRKKHSLCQSKMATKRALKQK